MQQIAGETFTRTVVLIIIIFDGVLVVIHARGCERVFQVGIMCHDSPCTVNMAEASTMPEDEQDALTVYTPSSSGKASGSTRV